MILRKFMPKFIDLQDDLIQTCITVLLKDKTTKRNIMFATDSYAYMGESYSADREITIPLLAPLDLKPRILKSQEEQAVRTRKKAEVFTPSWLCCKMNNHLDDEWFGTKDVFNRMDGEKWTATETPVVFPEGKNWKQYVDSRRLEITCGEAPYVVSRYDTSTGSLIDIKHRIGILDRKLRVVNENTQDRDDWFKWTLRAFQSVYGYEWQGDSLLIARMNLLLTFMEYYKDRWEYNPTDKKLYSMVMQISNVISWNFWQMDGLTGTVPYKAPAEKKEEARQLSFSDMGWGDEIMIETKKDAGRLECILFDWRSRVPVRYNSMKKG